MMAVFMIVVFMMVVFMMVVFMMVVFMMVVFMIVVFMIQLKTTINVNRQQSIQFLIHFLKPRNAATIEQRVFVVTNYLRTESSTNF